MNSQAASRRRARSQAEDWAPAPWAPTRPVLPDPAGSEQDCARFHHRDIATLSGRDLWAEQLMVERALGERLFRLPQRARLFWVDGTQPVSDVQWLTERRARLQAARKARP